jgi:hypothetical protein
VNKIFAAVCLMWACCAQANPNSNWLTVVGDRLDPAVGTIEIDPNAISVVGDQRTMLVRVSRPQERVSSDGVAFRSYLANVQFDCVQKNARFVSVDFFEQWLWQGKPHKSMAYGPTQIRPVLFRFFEPNPLEKLVRAACLSAVPK